MTKEGWKIISENKIEISKQILDEKTYNQAQDESTEDIVLKNKAESRNLELKETLILMLIRETTPLKKK